MSVRVIVVSEDRETFFRWCRENNENPHDPRWIMTFDPSKLRDHRHSMHYPYGLLLLNQWWRKAREEAVWDESGKEILGWEPNDRMKAILMVFLGWSWNQLISNHAVIEEV